ncbi:hypothetical protein ACFSQE_12250 [Vogesella fluminis]|uniref:Flagellar protein FliT n=1 Tax=Vogesella fluminis TaxID=1069161 RepID=A0ABQ3HAN0_9NEIS|nr:hypothetical protein [Vogesella fluminis]GHD79217.1 hypothetical protein GCM10011419_22300 [Vogesella fluminis]
MAQPELTEDWRNWLLLARALSAAVETQDWERAVVLAEQLVAAQATLSPLSALPADACDGVLPELLDAQRLLQDLAQQVSTSKGRLQPELALLKTRQNLLSAYKSSP